MWVAFNPSKIAHNFTVVSAIEAWYETSQELIFDVFFDSRIVQRLEIS